MLDDGLAQLYQVPTGRLNERVKRNLDRFSEDFMFQLTSSEWENLMSQSATSSWAQNSLRTHGSWNVNSTNVTTRLVTLNSAKSVVKLARL